MNPSTGSPLAAPPADAAGPTAEAEAVADAVAQAAEAIAPAWPLENFVASNPLAGLEPMGFDLATDLAAGWFGAATLPSEADQRAAFAEGRISGDDLREALRSEGVLDPASCAAGCSVEDLFLADLLVGVPAPAPRRSVLTPAEYLDHLDGGARAAAVDEQVTTWCRLVLDDHARFAAPGAGAGLWAAWRSAVALDPRVPRAARDLVSSLPDDPAAAVASLVPPSAGEDLVALMRAHLCSLAGWASHLQSSSGHALDPAGRGALVELVAVRVCVEHVVVGDEPAPAVTTLSAEHTGDTAQRDRTERARVALRAAGGVEAEPFVDAAAELLDRLPLQRRQLVWLAAAEGAYRRDLLRKLPPVTPPRPRSAPVQMVNCIDVRSEGLRRHVERVGGWETFGAAGFFGVAMRLHREGEAVDTARCPVILQPSVEVEDGVDPTARGRARGRAPADPAAARAAVEDSFTSAKEGVAAPLALAEMAGWLAGPVAAMRTFLPGRRHRPAQPTRISTVGAGPEERVALAAGLLGSIGLTSGFAPLVLVCGHGSRTDNNPYEAGLACGACGGHPGGDNARVAVELLNDPAVRRELARAGIDVPDATWFVAAEHDTASDEVTLADVHLVPGSHMDALEAAQGVLREAGAALRLERADGLPGTDGPLDGADAGPGRRRGGRLTREQRVSRRGRDWAEAVPEWGLANNAAFVIGPRSLTAGADLERRTFLHSYDPAADPDAAVLAQILGGPGVVTHWISSQYFFSALDPEVFGAGTKATHNVLGGTAVLSGAGGDLRRGLPMQSVQVGSHRAHEPLRLLVVVDRGTDGVDAALDLAPTAAALVDGGWVTLVARSAEGGGWARRVGGRWVPEGGGPPS